MKQLTNKDVEEAREFVKHEQLERIFARILFVLGFKSSLAGTRYLEEALILRYNGASALCKDIYPQIAAKFGSTPKRVERSIRHAIVSCYISGNLKQLNDIFRCQVVDSKYSPTNSELIGALCTGIHIERFCCDNTPA